jgi:hypothetical protein
MKVCENSGSKDFLSILNKYSSPVYSVESMGIFNPRNGQKKVEGHAISDLPEDGKKSLKPEQVFC